jgi:hypothetical protein
MTRTLGILCKKDEIFCALAVDGKIVDDAREKLTAPALLEASERLRGMQADIQRVITETGAETVRVLLPEQTYKDSYARIAPRVALETLVRLAALDAGANIELVKRATARSRLGMPKTGPFESHVGKAIGDPVGKYWNAGRNLAAAAALADD